MTPAQLLTADEAAKLLRMPLCRVKRLAKRQQIPCVILPDQELRFDASELAVWVADHKQPEVAK